MSESNDRPRDWLDTELDETLEEMFELEFSEPMMDDDIRRAYKERNPDSLDNRTYFRNLLRLQTELIKLQDWVEHTGAKVLVICEGRDSAGKVASSNVLSSVSTLGWRGLWRCQNPLNGNNRNGIFNAMCRICQLEGKLFCLTALGTTALALSG